MSTNESIVEEVFYAALECHGPAERAAVLETRCADDHELRRRVDRLLLAHSESQAFLAIPSANLLPILEIGAQHVGEKTAASIESDFCTESDNGLGTLVAGRYRLLEKIGEGGMGTVYSAEQLTPIRRIVALKLLRSGLESASVVRRFEAERQALALMDHPHIARVFDAGTTEESQPFFVMELFQGAPITRYCDNNRIGIRERVQLFLLVCDAVQHAHQRGIIHRDLKPDNVLVADGDGSAAPKVIDFGIAKAVGEPMSARSMHTGLGTIVGTPEYMSPEQAELDQQDIDTRTDVYSLGVLLYELLTGSLPFEGSIDRPTPLLDILRMIRDDEPTRPSVRIGQCADRSSIATQRSIKSDRLPRHLRGELDWIVLKCLEKSRECRYASARDLASDLRRFLAGEPILSRSTRRAERLVRYCRRKPAVAGLTAAVAFSLMLGLAVSTYFAVAESRHAAAERLARAEERHQRELARQQTARANISEARALRKSNRPGQRFGALRAIGNAMRITGPTRELADEALAALCLPDWEVDFEWPGYPPDTTTIALSPTFDRYARVNQEGTVTIRSLPDDRELACVHADGLHADYGGIRFSDCGGLLFEMYDRPVHRTRVWSLMNTPPILICQTAGEWAIASPDEHSVAIANGDAIEIWDVSSQSLVKSISAGRQVRESYFGWHPSRPYLVISFGDSWQILDVGSGEFGPLRPVAAGLNTWPAFHPNGQWIVWTTRDSPFDALMQEIDTGLEVGARFRGHAVPGAVPTFSRLGDAVFSNDWQHVLRMWEPRTGQVQMSRPSQNRNWLVVSADNRRIGPEIASTSIRVLRFESGREHGQLVVSTPNDAPVVLDEYNAISPDGRLIACSGDRGIVFIDTLAGVQVGFWPTRGLGDYQVVRFLNDGSLVTYGGHGWERWPITCEQDGRTLRFGSPDRSFSWIKSVGEKPFWPSVSPDGRVLCGQRGMGIGGARIICRRATAGAGAESDVHVGLGTDVRSVSVSTDGSFAATGVHSGIPGDFAHSAQVWDTTSGKLVAKLESRELCTTRFSPRGSRLVVHSGDTMQCFVYRVGTWMRLASFQTKKPGIFSPDERLFAVEAASGEIALCHGDDLREFARLSNAAEHPLIPLFITPDNGRLIAADSETNHLLYWDLALLRRRLDELDLAGEWPVIAATVDQVPGCKPLHVVLPIDSSDPQDPPSVDGDVPTDSR